MTDGATSVGALPGPAAPSVIEAALAEVHEACRGDASGAPAAYIPELARVDPDRFGIAVATVDGCVYQVGDADHRFTIQSISKPFVYGLALDDHGLDHVMAKVGVEPSGEAFNAITMDEQHNRPMNPMVNAGAIACAAMVDGPDLAARVARLQAVFSAYAGRPLEVDDAVFASERATGDRNRAIAYLELSSGMIEAPVDEHLDLYFRQCSLLVSTVDLALMAATLANGGVQPRTGVAVISPANVAKVLSVMATCGMYDWSGEWMHRVGLPAKSGVGGGVLAVLPGQLGIAAFSPRLDAIGNSVRGVQACEDLGRRFGLHLFDVHAAAARVVRRTYDAAQAPSRRVRPAAHRAHLATAGSTVVVVELQGDLYFATAEHVARMVEAQGPAVRTIILDGCRLGRADATALALLRRLAAATAARARLLLAGAPRTLAAGLSSGPGPWPAADLVPDVDAALEQQEDALLAAAGLHVAVGPAGGALAPADVEVLGDLTADELAVVAPHLVTVVFRDGERIVAEGDRADRLFFLVAGRATVRLSLAAGDGGRAEARRLRTFEAGVAFGETALFAGGSRTADVVADGPATCLELSLGAIEEIRTAHPVAYARLLLGVGRNLSSLLAQAMVEIRALGA